MASVVRARIVCVRGLLSTASPEDRVAASRTQSMALVDQIDGLRNQLSTEDRATLGAMAMTVSWNDGDGGAVLAALVPPLAKAVKRRALQDFRSFIQFCTQSDWSMWLDNNAQSVVVLMGLIRALVKCGCRLPSEHTLKWLTSVWLTITVKDVSSWSPEQMQETKKHVSKEFHRIAIHEGDPAFFMRELPPSPQLLLAQAPIMYNRVFARGEPAVPCPLDLNRLRTLDDSFRCRGRGPAPSQHSSILASQAQPQGDVFTGQSMVQFGQMMLGGMREIQHTQQAAIKLMMSGARAEDRVDDDLLTFTGGVPGSKGGGSLRRAFTMHDGSHEPTAAGLAMVSPGRGVAEAVAHVPALGQLADDRRGVQNVGALAGALEQRHVASPTALLPSVGCAAQQPQQQQQALCAFVGSLAGAPASVEPVAGATKLQDRVADVLDNLANHAASKTQKKKKKKIKNTHTKSAAASLGKHKAVGTRVRRRINQKTKPELDIRDIIVWQDDSCTKTVLEFSFPLYHAAKRHAVKLGFAHSEVAAFGKETFAAARAFWRQHMQ